MASSRTKRRRKHRGTQAGTVSRSAGPSGGSGAKAAKPASKEEARAQSRRRREERLNRPPTWRGALNRAAISAVIFGVLVYLLFDRPAITAAALAAIMLLVYIPLGYYTDRLIHTRRQRRLGSAGGGGGAAAQDAGRPRGRR